MFSKTLFQAAQLAAVLGVDAASAVRWNVNMSELMPHQQRMVESEFRAAARGEIPPFGQSFLNDTKILGAKVPCVNGMAGKFPCEGVDLLAFVPDADLVSDAKFNSKASDIWGWTNPADGKEWVIHTTRSGFSFVDISDPINPVPVAFMPRAGTIGSVWSDVKIYKNTAYCVADSSKGQFMQVVDLTRVAGLKPQENGKPVEIKEDLHFTDWKQGSSASGGGSAHNIVINEDTGFAYIVGADSCDSRKGGLFAVDLKDPLNPKAAGCFFENPLGSRRGYSHDAQCVVYKGPDARYTGQEICLSFNEDRLAIFDATDKQNVKTLSVTPYDLSSYCHQGWFNDAQTHLLMNDELDEMTFTSQLEGGRTRTLIWDVSDLEKPIHSGDFNHPEKAVDHNLYIVGNIGYLSNYRAGLKVLSVTDIAKPDGVTQIGKFDCSPELGEPTNGDAPEFGGTWSNYPYFKSGVIALSNIEHGLFLLKLNGDAAQP